MLIVSEHPPLFKTLEKGKIRIWKISVVQAAIDGPYFIQTVHGYMNGKLQTDIVEVTHGTNVGKKNEKNILQKATAESKKKWQDKKDKHQYNESVYNHEKHFTPMLAMAYDSSKVNFPCFVQPKLDGVRCSVHIKNGELIAESRTGILFHSCSQILGSLESIFKDYPHIVLDGELYSETLSFEVLVGLVKKKTNHEKCQFHFHVYDIFDVNNEPFKTRFLNNNILQSLRLLPFIRVVNTVECNSPVEIDNVHNENKKTFEGSIIRNNTPYDQKRSINLMKLKDKQENEFEIIGYKEGKGREKGQVVWECKTNSGEKFQCRPMGTKEERQLLFLNADKYINCKYTVEYQELTKKGVPRFPVGKCIRDYE